MISRNALIITALALGTLPLEYAYAGCKNGVCSLAKKPQPRKKLVRKNTITKVAAVKRGCKNGICKLRNK